MSKFCNLQKTKGNKIKKNLYNPNCHETKDDKIFFLEEGTVQEEERNSFKVPIKHHITASTRHNLEILHLKASSRPLINPG